MLRHLDLENFRAFSRCSIPLSRLNIFTGPNNSGKSSIISAINLIAQNIKKGTQEFSLLLNGPYCELGTYYDVVHGHSARSSFNIVFDINQFHYEYRFRYRPQKREIYLSRAFITDGDLSYTFTSVKNKQSHYIQFRRGEMTTLVPRVRARFYGLFLLLPMATLYFQAENISGETARRLREFVYKSMYTLEQHFTDFDSVGAFRAAPQRTYYYTGEAPSSVGRHGENFAQMLASSAASRERTERSVIRSVANWFNESGVARDVRINALTSRHFELTVEDHTGSKNNITDSGFGCSQVLPVLIGGYNLRRTRTRARSPVYVVQEPEIHLHPSAAAHLGSYFSTLARDGVQCFVETHSENIVLRVARHVALGELSPDDVRIYWISSSSGQHEAIPLPLREDGTFATPWPEGFFPTRASETLQLARASAGIPDLDVDGIGE